MWLSKMRIASFCLFLVFLIAPTTPPLQKIAHAEVPETATAVSPQTASKEPSKTSDNNADTAPVSMEVDQELDAYETVPISGWYITILMLAIVTALGSVGLSAWLYLWRIKITESHALLVPENLVKATEQHSNSILDLRSDIPQLIQNVDHKFSVTAASSQNIEESLVRFQSALKERDQEISRYKSGHDVFVYRRFLLRFLSVYQMMDSNDMNSPENLAQISKIRIYFEDAFEECGVELYSPKIGINFLENNNLFDENIAQIDTENVEQDYEVAGIIRPGLRVIENPTEIIVRAKVSVFRYKG